MLGPAVLGWVEIDEPVEVLALGAGVALHALDLVQQPVFVAILLSATSLGILVPVLKDSGTIQSTFGQLVIAAASIADFAAVILLSLLFSREATSTSTRLVLLGSLLAVAVTVISPAGAAALVAAGLLSVLMFPALSLRLLRAEAASA